MGCSSSNNNLIEEQIYPCIHDIKNHLNCIVSSISLLKLDKSLNEKQKRFVVIIDDSSKNINTELDKLSSLMYIIFTHINRYFSILSKIIFYFH